MSEEPRTETGASRLEPRYTRLVDGVADRMGPEQWRGAGWIVAEVGRQIEFALATIQLSAAQYRMLGWLAHGPVASSILADRLFVTPGNITGVVDGLVARGFVERSVDSGDRRRLFIALTPAGERVLAAADTIADYRLAEMTAQAFSLPEVLFQWEEAIIDRARRRAQ